MDPLPDEVILLIFENLPLDARAKCRLVSRRFKLFIEDSLRSVDRIMLCAYFLFPHINYVPAFSRNVTTIDTSFWKFINTYCAPLLNLYFNNSVPINNMLPASSKIKSIICRYFTDPIDVPFHQLITEHFFNLEEFRSGENIHFCRNFIESGQNRRINHLSLPCDETNETCLDVIPRGVKSLFLNYSSERTVPILTNLIASSLKQLTIRGTPIVEEFPDQFNSLCKLTITDLSEEHGSLVNFFPRFKSSKDTLKELSLDASLYEETKREIYNCLPSFINMTKLNLNIVKLTL